MAVAIASTSFGENAGGTSTATLSPPTGSATGDVLVAVVAGANSATPNFNASGWTALTTVGRAGTLACQVFARVYNTSDTTYGFSPTASAYMKVGMARVTGADTTLANWQASSTYARATTGTSTTNVATSITALFSGGMSLTWSGERTTAAETDLTSVSGATKALFVPQVGGSAIETVCIAYNNYSGTTVPSVTFTYPNTQASNGLCGHIVIPAASAPPTSTLVCQVSDGDDTFTDGQFWVSDGADGFDAVSQVLQLPPEFMDFRITDMLAEAPFYWAHRGGSANWLEMSTQAYTNAIWHGAKVVEVSVNRSSDGVWVMHHDTTTTRMTGSAYTIASTPWSTLAGLTQSGNGYSGPIERLADYFALGYHTHIVTVIDNKTYANWTELLDLIEAAFPGGRAEAIQRVIIKSFTGTGLSHLQPAYDRGYTQWGYFYDDEGQANATDVRINILGLNYDATQPDWDAMTGTGKPVVGHVIPDSAAATTALSKGADGLQVADVTGVIPQINPVP